jgi:stage II sporulation protein D
VRTWSGWIVASIAVASALMTACERRVTLPDLSGQDRRAPGIRVQMPEGARLVVRDMRLEEYVVAAALSEFGPSAGDVSAVERMYELQTIISRTYAVAHIGRHAADGFDLCATTHCQLVEPGRVRTSRWAAHAGRAAKRTAGTVLAFEGRPAQALFHADCGGHTSAADAVWNGTPRPYLPSQPDQGPAREAHVEWQYVASEDAVRRALDADSRTKPVTRLAEIAVVSRDEAGRARMLTLRGGTEVTLRGDDLRQILNRAFGPRAIRSTMFDVRRTASGFEFSGRGYGHGVGLCQAGAQARLAAGRSPADVLHFYFPGTTLSRIAQ